jgi:hypothetical protein
MEWNDGSSTTRERQAESYHGNCGLGLLPDCSGRAFSEDGDQVPVGSHVKVRQLFLTLSFPDR